MELFQAHQQWSTRPADERFETLRALYDASYAYAQSAREKKMPISDIRTEAIDGNVQIVGKQKIPAKLTHWSFGQLAARVGAPAGYLRDLPATLAVQNLNHGLAHRAQDDVDVNLLLHQNGGLLLRAFTSDKYTRIWNWEVAERLLELEQRGWKPATPDVRFDGGDPTKCQVCNGTGDDRMNAKPAPGEPLTKCTTCKGTGRAFPALYASDHDMFVFVKNDNFTVKEPGSDDELQRGVIAQNSEVGAGALKLTKFLYRKMCGNHIIWGASKVVDISVRHVGDAKQRWGAYQAEIQKYADTGAAEDEAKIRKAKVRLIGDDKEAVLDKLFGMRFLNIPMKTLDAGYEATVPDQDGDPRTVWGMVQGLTRHSQKSTYADQRTDIDRAAGKLMEADF